MERRYFASFVVDHKRFGNMCFTVNDKIDDTEKVVRMTEEVRKGLDTSGSVVILNFFELK